MDSLKKPAKSIDCISAHYHLSLLLLAKSVNAATVLLVRQAAVLICRQGLDTKHSAICLQEEHLELKAHK